MFTRTIFLALATCAACASVALAIPGIDETQSPSPPTIAAKSDEPMKAAAGFGMPEGFVVELFAAEPDLANPVAFSVDEHGRVFVCETFRQSRGVTDNRFHDAAWVDADRASQSVEDRLQYHLRLLGDKKKDWEAADDRVRLLIDADRDGRADTASVFAERFNRVIDGSMAGILARRGDVFVTCIPSLYRLRDVDSDGKADTSPQERTILSTGYGARVAYRGHDLHGVTLGHDGRLYYTIGDRGYRVEHDGRVDTDPGAGAVFRCEPDGSGLEIVAHGLRNPQELAFDDLGNLFTVDNNSDAGDAARLVHVMPGAEIGWNMAYQYFPDRGPWHREKIWHLAHAEQPAWILPPVAHITSGPCGFAAYPGTGLTPHFNGRFLIVDFRGGAAGSGVTSFRVRPKGAGFEAYDQEMTFKGILPTDVEIGPDGAVWVADWVEGWTGCGKGRLWRFRPQDQDLAVVEEVRGLLAGDWSRLNEPRLLELLAHADRRLRREAQWELARRAAVGPLRHVIDDTGATTLARVHAVWGLEQVGRASPDEPNGLAVVEGLVKAAADPAWEVRLVASRSLGELPADMGARPAIRAALRARLDDEHPHVRATAAIAAGRLGHRDGDDPGIVDRLVGLASTDIESDPVMRHAVVMGLSGAARVDTIAGLTSHADATIRLAACLALRRLADPSIAACLNDSSARVVLEAARAIHDLPIPAALPALAAKAPYGPAADPFLRRAISAAERIGTPESAAMLVRAIGRPDASGPMRVMALDALRTWEQPSPKNRVTNVWQPHALPRDAAVARAALEPALPGLLAGGGSTGGFDEATRAALLATASALGIREVAPLLVAWCHDTTCSPASRVKAFETLVAAANPAVLDIAATLVRDQQPLVRIAARGLRATKLPPAETVPELQAAVASPDVAERQAAVVSLGRIDDEAARQAVASLAEQLAAGSLDPTFELEVLEAAAARLGTQKVEELTASRRKAEEPLSAWSDVVAGGDATRGRAVFLAKTEVSCVRCHKAENQGGDVGPALDGIAAKRDRRHLLESIVQPDAKVDENYRTTVVVTDGGKTVAGIVVSENGTELKLKTPEGKVETISVASIEERTSGPSAMPADLAGRLTRREMRDLLAWLAGLTK
jgi:quinoprotein glucose dehydrogenase